MSRNQLAPLLSQIRRAAGAERDVTDRQLLDRFIADHDEAAFGTLLDRHGPLVLSVCRRMLGHEQDAEDALQGAEP
jgi:hypothetical protein